MVSPEDPGAVELDLLDELIEVWGRSGEVVFVELQVPVAPVERPLRAGLRVTEAADREPSPLGTNALSPRRSTLEDGDRAVGDVDLVADLVTRSRRHLGVSPVDPLANPGEVELRNHSVAPSVRSCSSSCVSRRPCLGRRRRHAAGAAAASTQRPAPRSARTRGRSTACR